MITLLKNSLANLKGHKLRLIIAFIWIIIGITSVVFVSSVGNAMSALVKQSFDNIAPRTAQIYFQTFEESEEFGDENSSGKVKQSASQILNQVLLNPFQSSDVQILSTIDGVESVKPSEKYVQPFPGFGNENSVYLDASYFDKQASLEVTSVNTAKYKLVKGRKLTKSDEGKKVIILDKATAKDIFGDESPLGKGLRVGNHNFEVVGLSDPDMVYDPIDKEFRKRNDFDISPTYSFVPDEAYQILNGNYVKTNSINSLTVKVKEGYKINEVSDAVINELSALHPNISGTYKVQDQSTVQKSTEAVTNGIDKFVTIITVVAMIVGGVGIMNIMYVSVMERNKEIGIRRALGAKPKTILYQFLIESVFITACGGVLGIIVGYAVTIYSKNMLPFRPMPSLNSFVYAFAAIVITGIVFGLVPAFKASKVDPIKIIYK